MEKPYPGERLDLPESGPNSIARPGKRVVALFIDWLLCYGVSALFFHANPWTTLGLFFLEQTLMIGLVGSSIGQALMGLRVGAINGKNTNILSAAVRSGLLCLFLPAIFLDQDQRGFHETIPGLVLVQK